MELQVNIQLALFTALNADVQLMAVVSGIYDYVPQDTEYPYVVIGDCTWLEWDTDTTTGGEATCTIHSWSRYSGRLQVKQIQAHIYRILHRNPLVLSAGLAIDNFIEFAETFMDPDGETHHGVQRLRIITIDG